MKGNLFKNCKLFSACYQLFLFQVKQQNNFYASGGNKITIKQPKSFSFYFCLIDHGR